MEYLLVLTVDIQNQASSSARFLVRCSYLEIYNEKISDLIVCCFLTFIDFLAYLFFIRILHVKIFVFERMLKAVCMLRTCPNMLFAVYQMSGSS